MSQTVHLRKQTTAKGERLRVESDVTDEAVLLDALSIESITWQNDQSSLLADLERTIGDLGLEDIDDVVIDCPREELRIGNEYAQISIKHCGDSLQIASGEGQDQIRLDSVGLTTLTRLENGFDLSRFLKTPFGPENREEDTRLLKD